MVSNRQKKIIYRLLTAVILSSSLLSANVCAGEDGFAYFNLAEAKPIKLVNPIYLDTSRTEKIVPKAHTSIPFNLRGDFNEADYFSSTIDDTPPVKKSSPPETTVAEEMPTQHAQPQEILVNDISPPQEETVFAPTPTASTFFSPLESDIQEESSAVETPPIFSEPEIVMEEDTTYTAEVNSEYDVPDVNLEGKRIKQVNIVGLKTIDPQIVLSKISTKAGSVFNSTALQQDLQQIYLTGYFTDSMSIEPTINPDETIDLEFVLKENIIVSDVSIIGNTVISTVELSPFVMPLKGLPQNLLEINTAIDKINDLYHEKGYILASVDSVEDTPDGALDFTILEGVINKIQIEGNERTKDYVITRNIMTQPKTVYNEEYLKKDLAKVYSSQIFDEVNREIRPSEENPGTYDVVVKVKEKSTNSLGLGGGIDTGLGAFGSISIREDNFLGRAQRVSLTGILGSGILLSDASIKNHMNYQVELNFVEPHFLNADNSLMSKLYYREMGSFNVPLAIERRIGFMAGVEHKVSGYDHLSTSLSAGVEHIHLKEGDPIRISQLYDRYNLNIRDRARQLDGGFFFNIAPGIKYSNLDSEETPREGIIAQARFTEAIGVSDFNHTNGRLSGAVTRFFPVFKKSSFSLTGKAGIKVHGDEMPEVMAYRLGGPYSIRGFRMNGVGAGESFVMGSAELATPVPLLEKLKWDIFKNMRLTFFVDAGRVFDPTISSTLFDRPNSAISAGIGLRVYVPGVGPISVDYGIPLTNPGDYGSENGYFTFGTGYGMNGYNY